MKIVIRKNNATLLNLAFIFWLVSEIMFEYSFVSRLALMVFVGLAAVLTLGRHWSYALTGYGLFALWSVLNIHMGHAVGVSTASKMTQTVFLNLLFLYAFVCYCRYIGNVGQVLKIYQWTVFLVCIFCLVGGLGGVFAGERLSILGINPNTIAVMAAFTTIIFFDDLLNKPKGTQRWQEALVIMFLLLTILLTGSRKGLIIPVIGIYVLICFRKPGKFVWYTLAVIVAAVVALYLLLNVEALYNVVGYRVEPVLQYLAGEEFEEGSLNSRVGYIQLGWLASQDNLFWGHGLDCFRLLRFAYGTYSHSNYIEILYSLGWTGIAIYYSPYVYALLQIPRAWRRDKTLTAMTVGLLIPFVVCDYMTVTYFTRTSLLIPVMVMLQLRKRGPNNEIKTIL